MSKTAFITTRLALALAVLGGILATGRASADLADLLKPLLPPGIVTPTPTPTPTAAPCPTSVGPDGVRPQVNVSNCGTTSANPYDTLEDSANIQKAINQIAAVPGGGYVYFPPDTDGDGIDDSYLARNIVHKSNVELYGTDRMHTVIKHFHPSGGSMVPMIRADQVNPTGSLVVGSISAGSTTLNVNNASSIPVGAVVGVKAAGGRDPTQSTTLSVPILGQWKYPIFVNNPASDRGGNDWATLGSSRFLQVDNEIIEYSSRSGNQFTVQNRNRWSTIAPHSAGTVIGQARRLVAEVVAKSGNQLTLSKPAVTKVTSAPVTAGAINLTVRGLTLDGNGLANGLYSSVTAGADPWPLGYGLARWVRITDTTVRNDDEGGVKFEQGTRDSVIENSLFQNNGEVNYPGSAHVFLVTGAIRNVVRDNVMSGPVDFSVFVDDRSEKSTEWDFPSDLNEVRGNQISQIANARGPTGIRVDGSSNQSTSSPASTNVVVVDNVITNGSDGISMGHKQQGIAPRKTANSQIVSNTINDATGTPCLDKGVNNLWDFNIVNPGGDDCPGYG